MLHRNQRSQFGENQLRYGEQVALALQQAGEFREVRFQPVLRGVLFRGFAQVADHLVDVVLEGRDFACGFDGDRPRQIAFGHGRRDFGDRADLSGKSRGHAVDVVGQIAPRAGCAGHLRLAAEFSFDTDFAGYRRDLIGEGGQRVDHVVDRFGQLCDFAFCFEYEFSFQVSVCDSGHDLRNTAHLVGQVRGHEVHVVGQVLPGTGDAFHFRLAAEFSFGTDFAGDACDFRGEGCSWSTIVLMVFFSSRISPRTSTVIFFDRSPFATAVVTAAMLRT